METDGRQCQVGCEDGEGLLHVHAEDETCGVCQAHGDALERLRDGRDVPMPQSREHAEAMVTVGLRYLDDNGGRQQQTGDALVDEIAPPIPPFNNEAEEEEYHCEAAVRRYSERVREKLRRHLTASGVPEDTETCPYGHCQLQFRVRVPEEVRRLPEDWMQQAGQARRCLNDGKSAVYESCSRQLDKALASAPAVCEWSRQGCDAYGHDQFRGQCGAEWWCIEGYAPELIRDEHPYCHGCGRRIQIAAAPTDGRE